MIKSRKIHQNAPFPANNYKKRSEEEFRDQLSLKTGTHHRAQYISLQLY